MVSSTPRSSPFARRSSRPTSRTTSLSLTVVYGSRSGQQVPWPVSSPSGPTHREEQGQGRGTDARQVATAALRHLKVSVEEGGRPPERRGTAARNRGGTEGGEGQMTREQDGREGIIHPGGDDEGAAGRARAARQRPAWRKGSLVSWATHDCRPRWEASPIACDCWPLMDPERSWLVNS